MRFTFAEAMTDPSYYLPLAKAAEAAGYEGFTIPDSIAYPEESDSTYPYTEDGNREFLEDKAFIETFVMAAAMGAVTDGLHGLFAHTDARLQALRQWGMAGFARSGPLKAWVIRQATGRQADGQTDGQAQAGPGL